MRERQLLKGSLLCLALISTIPAGCGDGEPGTAPEPGGFLYVLHRGSSSEPGQLSSYGIDRGSGGLSVLAAPPTRLGHGLTALTVAPSGRFVFACSMESQLWAFRS